MATDLLSNYAIMITRHPGGSLTYFTQNINAVIGDCLFIIITTISTQCHFTKDLLLFIMTHYRLISDCIIHPGTVKKVEAIDLSMSLWK